MTEKNRHILDEALKGLPEHKAGAAGWESVAGGLAQAEEAQFLLDNLSSLPAHKAPAAAWSGIAAALKAPFFSLSGLMKTAGFIAAGAAIVTAVLLFVPEQYKEESVNSADPEKAVTTEEAGIAVTSAEGQKLTPSENTAKIIAEPNGESSVNEETPFASSMSSSPVYNMVSQREDNNDFAGAERDDAIAANTGLVSGRNDISLNTLLPLDFLHLKVADRISARKTTEKVHTDYYSKRGTVEFGIAPFYSLINYQQAELANMEVPESISGFGIDLMADFPRFFLKTGVSYLSFREKAKYEFEYRRNELVYSYNYVDSAFINQNTGDILYHTSQRNIYDSVAGNRADEIEYEYRVLQVPLVAGFKIYNKNHISFSINAGIGADLRIGGREYRPVFNEEDARVVNVVNYLDYRFRINWRLIAGAGFYYRISNRFSFYLEPSYQRYLKSMHQHSGSGNVSYLEIKSGLVWKF